MARAEPGPVSSVAEWDINVPKGPGESWAQGMILMAQQVESEASWLGWGKSTKIPEQSRKEKEDTDTGKLQAGWKGGRA